MKRKHSTRVTAVREPAGARYARRTRAASADILAHVDPTLHTPSGGNLDARRVAARFGIPPARLASALGYTPQGLLKNPASDRLQPGLAELASVLARLHVLLADDRSVSIWLRAPHPDLGGATPLSFILSGRTGTVAALLHLAESGQTT